MGLRWMGAIGLTALLACQKTEDTGSDGDDDSDVSIEVTWGDAQTVASGGTDVITLTFNNTPVGMRDGDNRLHLVWLDGTDLVYGRLESSGWVTGPLERLGSSGLAKPTLASGGGGLVVAWLERLDGNMHVVGTYSADDGATWSTPLQLSTAAHNAVNPSLYAWANENGGTSAVVSWGDEETGQIVNWLRLFGDQDDGVIAFFSSEQLFDPSSLHLGPLNDEIDVVTEPSE